MRNIILFVFSLIATEMSAQQVLFYRNDGTRVKLHVSEVDSIRFMDDEWVDPTGEPNRLPMKVIATFEGDKTATRSNMHRLHMGQGEGTNKTMLWQAGDKIILFQGQSGNEFTLEGGGETREGTFTGVGTNESGIAVYPYRALVGEQQKMTISDGMVSEIVLPTRQTAIAGGYDSKAALMMGRTVNGNADLQNQSMKIGFHNICSYLVVTPEKDLRRVIVTSKKVDEYLSGNICVRYEGGVPKWTIKEKFGSNKVVLEGPLSAGQTYYIAVLPGTLKNGFVVSSYVNNEQVITKEFANEATFQRSQYHDCTGLTRGNGEGFVVDLDLTGDGVHRYWSTRNIGASTPQDHGDYFAWGEVVPLNSYGKIRTDNDELKDVCTWKNYKYGDGGDHNTYNNDHFVQKYGGSMNSDFTTGGDDGSRELEPADDAASTIWDSPWKMPSKADFDALLSQCKYEYIADYHNSGIRGYVFYNKNYTAEKGFTDDHVIDVIQSQESADYGKEITHIFLPYGGYYDDETIRNPNSDHGYYWSSTVEVNSGYNFARAHDLVMTRSESEGNVTTSVEPSDHADFRRGGQNIRPIYNRTFTDSEKDQEAKAKIVLPVILPTATK